MSPPAQSSTPARAAGTANRIGTLAFDLDAVAGPRHRLDSPDKMLLAIKQELLPTIDAVIAKAAGPHADVVIPALELDLGNMPLPVDWDSVRSRLRNQLSTALAPYLAANAAPTAAPNVRPRPTAQAAQIIPLHPAPSGPSDPAQTPTPTSGQATVISPDQPLVFDSTTDRETIVKILAGQTAITHSDLAAILRTRPATDVAAIITQLQALARGGTGGATPDSPAAGELPGDMTGEMAKETARDLASLLRLRAQLPTRPNSPIPPSTGLIDALAKILLGDPTAPPVGVGIDARGTGAQGTGAPVDAPVDAPAPATAAKDRPPLSQRQAAIIAQIFRDKGLRAADHMARRLFAPPDPARAADDPLPAASALQTWASKDPTRAQVLIAALDDARLTKLLMALVPPNASALRQAITALAKDPENTTAKQRAAIALLARQPLDLAAIRQAPRTTDHSPPAVLCATLAASGLAPLAAADLAIGLSKTGLDTPRTHSGAEISPATQPDAVRSGAIQSDATPRNAARSVAEQATTRPPQSTPTDPKRAPATSATATFEPSGTAADANAQTARLPDSASVATARATAPAGDQALYAAQVRGKDRPSPAPPPIDKSGKVAPPATAPDQEWTAPQIAKATDTADTAPAPETQSSGATGSERAGAPTAADTAKLPRPDRTGSGRTQAPDPDLPAPDLPTSDRSTPDVPGPDMPAPQMHTPDAPASLATDTDPQPRRPTGSTKSRRATVPQSGPDPALPANKTTRAPNASDLPHQRATDAVATPTPTTGAADPPAPDGMPAQTPVTGSDDRASRNASATSTPPADPLPPTTAKGVRQTTKEQTNLEQARIEQTGPTKTGPTKTGPTQPNTDPSLTGSTPQLRETAADPAQPARPLAPSTDPSALENTAPGNHAETGAADHLPPDDLGGAGDTATGFDPASQTPDALLTLMRNMRGEHAARIVDLFSLVAAAMDSAPQTSDTQTSAQRTDDNQTTETKTNDAKTIDTKTMADFWLAALATAATDAQGDPALVAAFVTAAWPDWRSRPDRLRTASARLGYAQRSVDPALRHTARAAIEALLQAKDASGYASPDALATAPQPAPAAADDRPLTAADRFLTTHAGLVLFNPYLQMLFDRMMISYDKKGVAKQDLGRAFAALWWLATGQPADTAARDQPHSDPLINLLSGQHVTTPPPVPTALDYDDRTLLEGLMTAVITQWGKLGQTSADGLRSAFVQRDGVLDPAPDSTVLTVQAGPFDMLLDGLPWAINLVALPWMPAPLHVKWRGDHD